MNKKLRFIILNALFGFTAIGFAVGGAVGMKQSAVKTDAATEQTFSAITGFRRMAHDPKSYLAIYGKDVVGTYGGIYEGNVFLSDGTAVALKLENVGGTNSSDDAYRGEGTRKFYLHTDYSSFYEALGTQHTFYLTKDSVFVNGDTSIKFGKEYEFTHIYDSSCAINDYSSVQTLSFDIKEMENRPETLKFRVGIGNPVGFTIPLSGTYEADIIDNKGVSIHAKIYDAGAGSTAGGNRRVYIEISKQTTNIIVIPNGTVFKNGNDNSKVVVLPKGYRINGTNSTNYRVDAVGSALDFATLANNVIVCDSTGATKPTFNTGYSWGVLGEISLALDADSKAELKNGLSSQNEVIKSFVKKYDLILKKYGTTEFPDFLGIGGYPTGASNDISSLEDSNYIVVILAAAISLMAMTAVLVLKRKKQVR